MSEPDLNSTRREWLGGLLSGGFALGALAAPSAPGATSAEGAAPGPAVRFASPRAEREAVIRVTASLRDVLSPWWYTGVVYGLRPGEQPRKLVRFEGCEIYRFVPQGDGVHFQTARTSSFFKDLDTGEVLERWTNPYTGKVVGVRANLLGGTGSKMVWSDAGLEPQFRRANGEALPSGGPQPLRVTWTPYGKWVWMRHDRVYPPGRPPPAGESSAMLVERRDLDDAQRPSAPALFSSTYMAPWLSWMDMAGQAGHTIWHADGLKLDRIDDMPAAFLDRLRRLHPGQLEVTL
jgi:hypothetical protein